MYDFQFVDANKSRRISYAGRPIDVLLIAGDRLKNLQLYHIHFIIYS